MSCLTSAAFLGRFQPFHNGHNKVAEKYRERFKEFKIIMGSAEKEKTEDNPLSFSERRQIIHECFPDLKVQELEDDEKNKQGNQRWVSKLEERSKVEKIISGNELVQRLVEEYTDMEIVKPEMHDPEIYSGTEIRRRIRSGEEWRYLVPKCSQGTIKEYEEKIRGAGIDYDFEPGWKKENAYHGTVDDSR